MNELKFLREDGNIPKSLLNEDHVSGLLVYLKDAPEYVADDAVSGLKRPKYMPAKIEVEGESATYKQTLFAVSSLETAALHGIEYMKDEERDNENIKKHKLYTNLLYFHLSEIFRINPGINLYMGVNVNNDPTETSFKEVSDLQNFSDGSIRQMAVYAPYVEYAEGALVALQGAAEGLEDACAPLSILYAPKVGKAESLKEATQVNQSSRNVSVVIAQDGAGMADILQGKLGTDASVTAIGTVLGLVSKAAVNESISWVAKFPAGISLPAFSDGTLVRNMDRTTLDKVDGNGFIFARTYPGLGGSYMSDSCTMAKGTDYQTIESMRTMDKAIRGIRSFLIPELGRPLYIESATGKLSVPTVEHLKTRANKALEDMEKAGELSGFTVDIDPNQNVLSNSTIEIIVKNVAVGVMRKVSVKIGFATSTNN